MKPILIGVSLLALMAPAAYAQTGTMAPSVQSEAGRFQVFFGFDSATLDAQGRQIVAQAAEEYRRGGQTQVTVTGHTDTSGSAAYNLELSQRRAEAVAAEMIRQGVPATEIETIGRGEEDLLVPTADGVREPRNRRVEIVMPQAPAPAPAAPVVAEPTPMPTPPPEPERPKTWEFALGGVYGHNFGETNEGTENDLAGVEASLSYLISPYVAFRLDQSALYGFNAVDDGWNGRSVAGLDFGAPVGRFRPYIGVNGGYVYGKTYQNGWVLGPELGFKVDLAETSFLYGKAAYDYQFQNASDFHKGVAYGGVGVGFRF
jgi:hypothetical protein